MPTFFVAELHPGCFKEPLEVMPPEPQGWRFFTKCEEDDFATCALIFDDFVQMSGRTQRDFINFWEWLFEAGKSGRPWQAIFQDGNLFHPVHEFTIKRLVNGKQVEQKCEVHQFKKRRTDIRVLFVYGRQMMIFVTHAFEKKGDKTPHSEQTRAEVTAREFLTAIDNGNIQLISAQVYPNGSNKYI